MMEPHISALDPWHGDFENFDIYEPSPVRTIAITPIMRAMDAAARAKREASTSTWAYKSQLSIENLRRDSRPAPLPGRRHDVRRFEVATPRRISKSKKASARFCILCPLQLTAVQKKFCVGCAANALNERDRGYNAKRQTKRHAA